MPEDKLSFLDEESAAETPEEVTAEAPDTAPADEPKEAKADKGEPKPETAEEEAAPPAAEPEKQREIPITALLDEREKRQAKERELQEAQRRMADMERQLKALQQPKEQPDFYADPEAAMRSQQSAFEARLWDEKLNISEAMARDKHGDEVVQEAQQAFLAEAQRNPVLYAELQRQSHPYDFVIRWHKREKFLAEVQDPDAWREQQLAQLREQLAAEQQSPTKPKAPPASLATATSAGGEPRTPGNAFDEVFPG